MAPILTIFGPNRSRRRDLFFRKISNERRRHRGIVVVVVVVVIVAVAVAGVAVVLVGRFWVAIVLQGPRYTSSWSTFANDHTVLASACAVKSSTSCSATRANTIDSCTFH